MKRIPTFLIGLVLLIVGCSTVNHALGNRYFNRNGYRIEAPAGTYQYKQNTKRKILTVGMGYERRKYIEATGDEKVDTVEFQGETYSREDDGTKKIFRKADREWKSYTEMLNVDETHKKWKKMNVSETLEHKQFFRPE